MIPNNIKYIFSSTPFARLCKHSRCLSQLNISAEEGILEGDWTEFGILLDMRSRAAAGECKQGLICLSNIYISLSRML